MTNHKEMPLIGTCFQHVIDSYFWNLPFATSGLLANYDIVVFDYDIGIYRYGLRYRSSVLMTTISCFSRYRVFHDIVKYTIAGYTIS